MGIVNLKWHDACVVCGNQLHPAERAAGWPDAFRLWPLAVLQRPWTPGIARARWPTDALYKHMVESCAPGGDMPHTSAVVPGKSVSNGRITVAGLRGRSSTSESIGWGGLSGLSTRNAYGERVYETEGERRNRLWKEANPPKQPDRIDHYVSAPAFAAWLSAQGQTPSVHVAAWFDAMWIDSDKRPIVPPESWAAQSPHGLQRCDGTADGRLVRLADVVAWLMQARELPCLNAVELVCTALAQSPSAANALYLLSESGYANVLKASHSFFYLPIMVVGEDYPEGTAEDKGLAGALKYMRSFWGESSAPGAGNWCGQHVLDPLAVRLSLAHRMWGYGCRGDDVATLTTDTDLPAPVETVVVTPASEPLNAIKKEGWICKKAALVKANATTWPTIEADFNHASENGLSSAAKAPGHGNWFETAALAWAKQRGKITEPNGAAPIVNSVFAMAGTVHTTK